MTGEYDAGYEHYIDGLHREIIDYQIEVEQVKGENAKLVMKLNAEHLVRQNVERENAMLRELVRDMADAIVDWYDLMDGAFACESVYEDEKFAPLFDRMRELGIEVDE